MMKKAWIGCFLTVVLNGLRFTCGTRTPPYTEEERVAEYYRRGHSWPVQEFVPNTEGWDALMRRRISQVEEIEDLGQRFNGFIATLGPGLSTPNFTEFGWGLSKAPQGLTNLTRQTFLEGLPEATPEDDFLDIVEGPVPLFVERWDLMDKISNELQPILEAWSGIELVPSFTFGFRVYRNESRLWMHTDKPHTHVISCIYHIASSEDSKPWPIVAEGFDGERVSVTLTPGDILFYESAKIVHGRPEPFHGSYYTSVFVHFYPKEDWTPSEREVESHYAIPPDWTKAPSGVDNGFPKLEMVGGSNMRELDCPNYWCGLKDKIDIEGPGRFGQVLTAGGKRYPLRFRTERSDLEEL